MKPAVLTGEHFITGDVACAEGALAAGCRFFAGYPITPATEIAEHMAGRLPGLGGTFIQMEDEIAAMAAILGASCAGAKSMTATLARVSHHGKSRFGICTENPRAVNVQRGVLDGPSNLGGRGNEAGQWVHGQYESLPWRPLPRKSFLDHTRLISANLRLPVLSWRTT